MAAAPTKDGETFSIYFWSSRVGCYEWKYTWKSGGSSSSSTGSSGSDDSTSLSETTNDITVDQVTGLKVTNKKGRTIYVKFDSLGGVDGYEIAYSTKSSMAGSKKFVSAKNKGYFVDKNKNVVKFKKGKTYYVRVRAFKKNSSGNKVYGPWSAKKKVKIKK